MTLPDLPVVLDFGLGGLAIVGLLVPTLRRRRTSALRPPLGLAATPMSRETNAAHGGPPLGHRTTGSARELLRPSEVEARQESSV